MRIPLTILALTALVLCADLPGQRRRGREWKIPEFQNVTFATKTFESKALGGKETPYGVFLPAGYDDEANADTRYPLVIWLHGLNEDHRRFAYRGGGQVLDEAVGEGIFPEAVFVCAEGGRRSFWLDGGKGRDVEAMVVDDLLPHLLKTYRIDESVGRRALAGCSMGGFGALKIALKHPSKFGAVSVHSAAVLSADPEEAAQEFRWAGRLIEGLFGDPVDVERYRRENVFAIVEDAEADAFAGLRIRFDCGTRDRYGLADNNVALHDLLEKKEIKHEWKLIEGGGHGWGDGYNVRAMPDALRFLARCFEQKSALEGLKGLGGFGGGEGGGGDGDGR